MIREKTIAEPDLMRRFRDILEEVHRDGVVYIVKTTDRSTDLAPSGLVDETGRISYVLFSNIFPGALGPWRDPEYGWPVRVEVESIKSAADFCPGHRRHPFFTRGSLALAQSIMIREYDEIKREFFSNPANNAGSKEGKGASVASPLETANAPDQENWLAEMRKDWLPGTLILGKYRILSKLEEEPTLPVKSVRAVCHEFGEVQVHLIEQDLPRTGMPSQFWREMSVLADTFHPNRVKLFDDKQVGQFTLIVSEYAAGRSLRDVLYESSAPLPIDQTFSIVQAIAEALASIHLHGVIHHFLNTKCIFINQRNGHEEVKVDFVAATLIDFSLEQGEQEHVMPLEWDKYVPLEKNLGFPSHWSTQSDVYTLGAMWYEMLTGQPPFVFPDHVGITARINELRNKDPLSPNLRNPLLENYPATNNLVLRLLSKQPEGRPRDGVALLTELEPVKEEMLRNQVLGSKQIPNPQADSTKTQTFFWPPIPTEANPGAETKIAAGPQGIAAPEEGTKLAEIQNRAARPDDSTDPGIVVPVASRTLKPDFEIRGRYRITRQISQGEINMYEAIHLPLDASCVIKVWPAWLNETELPFWTNRIYNDVQLAYRLRSPNVVRVLDFDQTEEGGLFAVYEDLKMKTLRNVLRDSDGPLEFSRALNIARGIGAGLCAVQQHTVVHCAISPEAIGIVLDTSGREEAKILDFTCAQFWPGVPITLDAPPSAVDMLKPHYASPEQWQISEQTNLDGRADIYALGCVLYEMLAGRVPFIADSIPELLVMHATKTPSPPSQYNENLTHFPAVDALVLRMLAKVRNNRPKDAQTFLQELAAVEEDIEPRTQTKRS
jgi:serine/threonine protein kinase